MKNTKQKDGNTVTNSNEKLTLELLSERHNALARYVGVPFYVNPDVVASHPASIDIQNRLFKDFAVYRVSLSAYVEDFDEVVFSAASHGKDIACGYIVDKDGNIESVAKHAKTDGAMVKLPLTQKSQMLVASVPNSDGKVAPDDIIVKLYSDGLLGDFKRVMSEILSRVMSLEKGFEKHSNDNHETLLAKNG